MKTYNVPEGTNIAVCGDIHAHEEQFNKIIKEISPSEQIWFVSVGDVIDKGFGPEAEKRIYKYIINLADNGIGYFVKGNHEVKRLIKAARNPDLLSDELFWVSRQPFCVSFLFPNRTRLTIIHGGTKPAHTWHDLYNNSEVVYIRSLDEAGEYIPLRWVTKNGIKMLEAEKPGKKWHETYDGRFGYIASGHDAQKDGIPKFYNYSCNLDTAVYHTGILTAQIFSQNGREELIQVEGNACKDK